MNSEYIVIERELLKHLIDENKRLKDRLLLYEEPKKSDKNEKQITIEEYIKTLKLGGKKDDENSK